MSTRTSDPLATRFRPFGATIFSEMTRLAQQHRAINLSQGFPDFEGPQLVIDHVVEALGSAHNQYARSMGHPELVAALGRMEEELYGLRFDLMSEVLVTSGATEAITSSVLGLVNPGDEVILFEPYYDSYPAAVAMAGGIARFCPLRFPDFALEPSELAALIGPKTRAIVLNSPHNPSGKVFSRDELLVIANLAVKHDLLVISDEVYEHLTYDGISHTPIAGFPGMRERTVTISSAGKTYSFTGWKIGWAFGAAPLIAAVQSAHQFVTFATCTPIQVGLARAMNELGTAYFADLRMSYQKKRDFMCDLLRRTGFELSPPEGTYFVLAAFGGLFSGTDREFAKKLVETVGVATIPPSAFYTRCPEEGAKLLRFAFCKTEATLTAASERLESLSQEP